eukprot:TRINITY_DN6601_c0_g1_i1.p1 TRINITY_DN6601_c0_g1~~TRINITY_DN6601_c0_g1_i1.p1  ORF type:complete len:358 (-),score=48.65 TRINITY_DN6601_c0_g1_i1:944-2017(-)
MIKIHCEALKTFANNYICSRSFLYILVVPGIFLFAFPFYWFVFLTLLWEERNRRDSSLYWFLGYVGFAFVTWIIFLIVVFCQSPNQERSQPKNPEQKVKRNGRRGIKSSSTEDLWSEDRYYPDIQSPDYCVSINAIQPDRAIDEPKMTIDETWDYNYEKHTEPPSSSSHTISFNCKPSKKNNARTSLLGSAERKSYQSPGTTTSSRQSYSGTSSSNASNSGFLQHQPLNKKRSASVSPYAKRRNSRHLPSPTAPRSPTLPKRGFPARGSPLNVSPRHLRPVRDILRPSLRSTERKKSPLVGNENTSPSSHIRTETNSKRAKGLHSNNELNQFEGSSIQKEIVDKRPMIDSYLKERVP